MSRASRSERPRTLYVAAGGGGDAIACAMIARQLEPDVERPLIASMSWDRLILDPLPGPRSPSEFIGLEPVGNRNFRVTDATAVTRPAASSLPRLARELPADVYLLDPYRGAPGMAEQLAELTEELRFDAIRLVDVGGDVVARGDEPELKSPLADAMTLAAVAAVAPDGKVIVAGPGLDGELPADDVISRCEALATALPLELSRRVVLAFQAVFAWHPSEASGLLWAATMGARGTVEVRDHRQRVRLLDSSPTAWILDASRVLGVNGVARALLKEGSLDEAVAATARAGAEPETRYEREKARQQERHSGEPGGASAPDALDERLEAVERAAEGRSVDFLTLRALHERLGCRGWPLERLARVLQDRERPPALFPPVWQVRGPTGCAALGAHRRAEGAS